MIGEKTLDDLGSPVLEQLALAGLLERGEYDRHLRRLRPHYRARREALVEALGREMPTTRLSGISAGLHAVALLPPGTDEAALVARALDAGILVHGLATAHFDPSSAPPGLIIGYGNIAPPSIKEGIRELANLQSRAEGLGAVVRERLDCVAVVAVRPDAHPPFTESTESGLRPITLHADARGRVVVRTKYPSG